MPTLTRLKLVIKTGDEAYAGTDATVYLAFCTPHGTHIYRVPTRRQELEAGKLDVYHVGLADGPELDSIQNLLIASGMKGPNPSWRILWIRIDGADSDGRSWKMVDGWPEKWLDTKDQTAPLTEVPLLRPFEPLSDADAVPPANQTLTRIP